MRQGLIGKLVKKVSIENIKRLSMNTHFYSLLIQSLLTGEEKPCELKLIFMALPILIHKESREKLCNANIKSRIDTLFEIEQVVGDSKISGRTRLTGFLNRYNGLKPYCKEIIIILCSENKVVINNEHKLIIVEKVNYKGFYGTVKNWVRCAYYLGIIFSKTTDDQLSYFLGVE